MMEENNFEITYNGQVIKIQSGNTYGVHFPDGRWLSVNRYPDDTKTVPVENENISYSLAFVWVVEDKSPGPGWLSNEQVQVIGELIRRKEIELDEKE
jgi:hypothetical protein